MEMKNVTIKGLGENNTMLMITAHNVFMIPCDEGTLTRYAESAINLIDQMASEKQLTDVYGEGCNSIGIEIMIAMLIIIKDGIGYYGKSNGCNIPVTPEGVKNWILSKRE